MRKANSLGKLKNNLKKNKTLKYFERKDGLNQMKITKLSAMEIQFENEGK